MQQITYTTDNNTEYQALFTFWDKEEAEIVAEFDTKRFFTEEEKQAIFRQVEAKVEWLAHHREAVLDFLLSNKEVMELFEIAQEDMEEVISKEQFSKAVYLYDFYCYVGEALECTFDIDTDPDYFLGHLVNLKLNDNESLTLETISG